MQSKLSNSLAKSRFRNNLIAARVFTSFGWLVLFVFSLLIIHILLNAFPLLKTPKIEYTDTVSLEIDGDFLGIKEFGDSATVFSRDGCDLKVVSFDLSEIAAEQKASVEPTIFRKSCEDKLILLEADSAQGNVYVSLSPEGLVEMYRVESNGLRFESQIFSSFILPESFMHRLKQQNKDESSRLKIVIKNNKLFLWTISDIDKNVMLARAELNRIDKLELYEFANADNYFPLVLIDQHIIVSGSQIQIIGREKQIIQSIELSPSQDLRMLANGRAFLLHDEKGFSVWGMQNKNGAFHFVNIAQHRSNNFGFIKDLAFDSQSGTFFLLSSENKLALLNPSSFEVVNTQILRTAVQSMKLIGDKVAFRIDDSMLLYSLKDAQGIITWKSLFSPVHYIGYEEASYSWQTSVVEGNDQAKFSIIPLLMGSLKASLLSLLVAVPLALGAAIFTAYFANSDVRALLKPSIEMIEAIPAVIIGFVAAVWLAPFAEKSLIALLILILFIPLVLLCLVFVHAFIENKQGAITESTFYSLCMTVLFAGLLFVIFSITQAFQNILIASPDGLFASIVASVNLSKTAVVVALALGLAITPTIYTLVDDAIFEVPEGAKHAAFALGATEVQTLFRVVLIVAFPSIISAIMLGFGRAFGETMIVLMVTGNTPIADWDLLSGLRSLTSNLTIELQETSQGSSHFHILFLTAAILFAFTFVVNSLASLFKKRLRLSSNEV